MEEHLAFALTDGRVGILAVSGRKVRSLPSFGQLAKGCLQFGSTLFQVDSQT